MIISTPLFFFTILSLISIIQTQNQNKQCISDEKCACINLNTEFEYQCSPEDLGLIIHQVPNKSLKIECNVTNLTLDMYPDISVGNVDHLVFAYCPIQKEYGSTLRKLNVTRMKSLELRSSISGNNPIDLGYEVFAGFETLEKISIDNVNVTLNQSFLDNLRNVTEIYLHNDHIRYIDRNVFRNGSKLRVLELLGNRISALSSDVFGNLNSLLRLNLWMNKLTGLKRSYFSGLKKLKQLELAQNSIDELEDDTFYDLISLEDLSLMSNKLREISSDTFVNNKALKKIRINYNPNLVLPDYIFSNLSNLVSVNIDYCNIEFLNGNVFKDSPNLSDISMKFNKLRTLPKDLFKGLINLKSLDLRHNQLELLDDEIFDSLRKLQILHLESNNLIEITDQLFKNTDRIKDLNLARNKIRKIGYQMCFQLKNIDNLDLSFNQYRYNYSLSEETIAMNPIDNCVSVQTLNLSHNLISSFPDVISNKVSLKSLDLRNNRITDELNVMSLQSLSKYTVKVYLNDNNISVLNFESDFWAALQAGYDARNYDKKSTIVYLDNNPIRCDCRNVDLIKYINDQLNPVVKTLVDIRTDDLACETPDSFRNLVLNDLKPQHMKCSEQSSDCPKRCDCHWRPYDSTLEIDCSRRGFLKVPKLNVTKYANIDVDLIGNLLEIAPVFKDGYENVTRLFLSNNAINNLSWVPPRLKVLHLNNNQLNSLDHNIIRNLNESTTIQNVTLSKNPWKCGCFSLDLQNFIIDNYRKINKNEIVCVEDDVLLFRKKDLCKSQQYVVMAVAVPILTLFLVAAIVLIVYHRYQQEIKVWLYAKRLCLWFVTEDEVDKDKPYDVFVCYSHKDEEFVVQNLLPVLESGPTPLKVCIHVRDWLLGEMITTQVARSVKDSKRTLVVLSDNFLESEWGKIEFQTAHAESMLEGRSRVIVVKYGVISEQKITREIQTYLKTNTYVEWGDAWFWRKMRYALPHKVKPKFYESQKNANVMLKIDEKFELNDSGSVSNSQSTPPALTLDPGLLQDYSLGFDPSKKSNLMSESPLLVTKND